MKNKFKIILGVALLSGVVLAASITKFYGDIDMQSHKITNLATPTANADGATKSYVDTQISSTAITLLPLSGGTMSGAINMGGKKITTLATPTATTDASTKGYVDDEITATQDLIDTASLYASNLATRVSVNATNYTDRAARYATNYVNTTIATLDTSITNLWKGVYKRLELSGGVMTGDISMGSHKISSLATPTASADATTKAYVDTLVYNSPSLIDSFQFYTLESGITNVARIFDIDSTGGYIRVSMLADNAEGQYGMTATLSDTNDNVQIEHTDILSKAGQGFKLWLTSYQTNDHYTSIKVRDDGNGCGVALARIKSVEAPDWDLYVCSNTSVPAENRFSYKYTQEMMYDIHKAYYSGVFAFVVGVSNTTSRTITCGVGGEARGFYSSALYMLSFADPTTLTIPPHSCSFVNAYITGYDDNTGASIVLSIANSVLMTIRDYRTYWSWSGMQP